MQAVSNHPSAPKCQLALAQDSKQLQAPGSPDANNNCHLDSSAFDGCADAAQDAARMEAMFQGLHDFRRCDVTELRAAKNPAPGVKCVLEAVCVLMGDKPTRVKDPKSGKFEDSYTTPIKKMLADRDFTSHVYQFDFDRVKHLEPSTLKKLQTYTSNPAMQPEKIKQTCAAAYGLCCWVHYMEMYARGIKPPRAC